MKLSISIILLPSIFGLASGSPSGSGCCTLDYTSCINWCGTSQGDCENCNNSEVGWLPNGAPSNTCGRRWSGCAGNIDVCCPGLVCQSQGGGGYMACLPPSDDDPVSDPTNAPVMDPTNAPIMPTASPVNPTATPTNAPTNAPVNPTGAPVNPTNPPVSPTGAPVSPTNPPVSPTEAPVDPTNPPVNSNGCCSLDHKHCVNWCGSTFDECSNCGNPTVTWLDNGELNSSCGERWTGCGPNNDESHSGCCPGLTCQWEGGYNACLPGSNDPTDAPVTEPTPAPVVAPTQAPVPTPAPVPTEPFFGELLHTDKALNAWEVFQGLDYITHKNDGHKWAVVASGGAAGSGTDVVSESQAYGLLITGTVLASWETHASKVSGSDRSQVLEAFRGYYNFWKDMCASSNNPGSNCQGGGNWCKSGSDRHYCLPDWKHSKFGGTVSTGPAPDADEDAIVGIILAVKAVENDASKPSWYDEARKWADASASALFEYEIDKSKGDYRLMKLGSCWGGWGSAGNNPSYHSPGSYRVMKDYQASFPDSDRDGYSGVDPSEWQKLIDTSYEVLGAVQCENDGALVPNWATVDVSGGDIIHTQGSFSGSGTPQYEYGAEAARTTFRVALDAAFYPERSDEWSPYISAYNYRMDQGFGGSSISGNSFSPCKSPGTSQNINMFGDWQNNAFIYGPTYTSLIAASPDVANREAMIEAAGEELGRDLPGSYYPRSWAMISALMLNGAMESAGNTLKQ